MMATMGLLNQNSHQISAREERRGDQDFIWDRVRKKWVRATQEERVRQWWIGHMLDSLGFPLSFFVVEKQLKSLSFLPNTGLMSRRADILCLAQNRDFHFYPLLLLECKATLIDKQALAQVLGYNINIGARFVGVVSSERRILIVSKDHAISMEQLPSFEDLLHA